MRMEHYILKDKKVVKVELLVWARWFEDIDNRRVAETKFGDVRISTVFLGIDHGFWENGPPLIFETLVFGGPLDDTMNRYSTWEEAEKGHSELVQRCRAEESK